MIFFTILRISATRAPFSGRWATARHPDVAELLATRAGIELRERRAADAGRDVDRAQAIFAASHDEDRYEMLVLFATVRLAQGRAADALALLDRAAAHPTEDPIDAAELDSLRVQALAGRDRAAGLGAKK